MDRNLIAREEGGSRTKLTLVLSLLLAITFTPLNFPSLPHWVMKSSRVPSS